MLRLPRAFRDEYLILHMGGRELGRVGIKITLSPKTKTKEKKAEFAPKAFRMIGLSRSWIYRMSCIFMTIKKINPLLIRFLMLPSAVVSSSIGALSRKITVKWSSFWEITQQWGRDTIKTFSEKPSFKHFFKILHFMPDYMNFTQNLTYSKKTACWNCQDLLTFRLRSLIWNVLIEIGQTKITQWRKRLRIHEKSYPHQFFTFFLR